jgi:lipid-A-disaccharide synthase
VILPFEVPLWRGAGVDAHYVGHPALDPIRPGAQSVDPSGVLGAAERHRGGAAGNAAVTGAAAVPRVALLPGSRAHEVRRHAAPMIAAVRELGRAGTPVHARLLASASLDGATRRWLNDVARRGGVDVFDVDPSAGAAPLLSEFDASLVASGTATLECALAGATPVIVYRASPLTMAVARRLVRTPFIGLPNIVLRSAVYPELIGGDVEARRLATALGRVLERPSAFEHAAEELRTRLAWAADPQDAAAPRGTTVAQRIASLLEPWLHGTSRATPARHATNTATHDAADGNHPLRARFHPVTARAALDATPRNA